MVHGRDAFFGRERLVLVSRPDLDNNTGYLLSVSCRRRDDLKGEAARPTFLFLLRMRRATNAPVAYDLVLGKHSVSDVGGRIRIPRK
jgi:hypothetical protein